jgi:glycosyltransferase involved in cell wall biosynthesis
MKIALYVPSWPPGSSANGIVTYAAQLVPALRQLGHEVYVLTPTFNGDVADAYTIDLKKIPIRRSLWSRVAARLFPERLPFSDPTERIERIVRAVTVLKMQHDLDVLEIEESHGWSLGVAQAAQLPLVVRLHGPWFLNEQFDYNLALKYHERIAKEGRGISAATLVTSPSAHVLMSVQKYYGLKPDRSLVIRNPIDTSNVADAWQLNACDTNRILYVGRFDQPKGGDLVVRAFASLATIYPSLRLTFVGPDVGIQQENGDRLSFDQFVHTNLPASCWPRIDFRGQLRREEVNSLRHGHFLTIVASQLENLPYAVLEAMSIGSPIIASDVGGIPELIRNGENGLLFASQNIPALVSACRTLLDNHALASALGSQARNDCIDLFNPQHIAMETISAYQVAIEAYRAGAMSTPNDQ